MAASLSLKVAKMLAEVFIAYLKNNMRNSLVSIFFGTQKIPPPKYIKVFEYENKLLFRLIGEKTFCVSYAF